MDVGNRSRYALLVSALGAVVLAVSVFLPWYGVSFTARGVALVGHVGDQVAAEFGNATLQGHLRGLQASLGALAGREFTALSAHQALKDMNLILLALAGLALLDALVPLARPASRLPDGAGASVALLGGVAAVCVLYRMIVRPEPAGNLLSLSLREGAWLALLGSLTMVAGALWSRLSTRAAGGEAHVQGAWSGLSGWTPGG
jgi:hypothetical protein